MKKRNPSKLSNQITIKERKAWSRPENHHAGCVHANRSRTAQTTTTLHELSRSSQTWLQSRSLIPPAPRGHHGNPPQQTVWLCQTQKTFTFLTTVHFKNTFYVHFPLLWCTEKLKNKRPLNDICSFNDSKRSHNFMLACQSKVRNTAWDKQHHLQARTFQQKP